MKVYFKILGITAGMQLLGFIVEELMSDISIYGIVIFLAVCCFSIIVDIVLSVKWGKTLAQKFVCIFLMPTNYTLILFLLYIAWFVGEWLDILTNFPSNFG